MGRKAKWILAVKKVFNHEANTRRSHRNNKSKSKWKLGKPKPSDPHASKSAETTPVNELPLQHSLPLAKSSMASKRAETTATVIALPPQNSPPSAKPSLRSKPAEATPPVNVHPSQNSPPVANSSLPPQSLLLQQPPPLASQQSLPLTLPSLTPQQLPTTSPPAAAPAVELKLAPKEEGQSKHAYSVALASAVAAEAAAVAAKAAAEEARLTATMTIPAKYRENTATIKIQTAFRGYQARRALRALRGLYRLKKVVASNAVKRQTTNTMRYMQTLARVQLQIHSRRIRMTEENQALQRQLHLKYEKELEKLKIGEEWDDSLQSKEQIQAKLLNKQEAGIRRERALAYAFSHQWKSSSRIVIPTFMDPNDPQWGWSWLERWIASRPSESRSTTEMKNLSWSYDREATKSFSSNKAEPTLAASQKSSRPSSRHSPLTPPSKLSSAAGKNSGSPSLRASVDDDSRSIPSNRHSPLTPPSKLSTAAGKISLSPGLWASTDDDSRSIFSSHSEQNKRNSIAGSSMRVDESHTSSPALPSYMASTESARAKSWFQSPSTAETSQQSVKKRLSYPVTRKLSASSMSSPPTTSKRHSVPPKVDMTSLKDVPVHAI